MLKFVQNIHAAHILSSRKLLQFPVYVNPDSIPDERKIKLLLLQERIGQLYLTMHAPNDNTPVLVDNSTASASKSD